MASVIHQKIITRGSVQNYDTFTVRAIIEKFKTTGIVTNKAEKGPTFILQSNTVGRQARNNITTGHC